MKFLNRETEKLLQECVNQSTHFPQILAEKFNGLSHEQDLRLRNQIKEIVDAGYFTKLQWADNVPWFGSITESGYDYFRKKEIFVRNKLSHMDDFRLLSPKQEEILNILSQTGNGVYIGDGDREIPDILALGGAGYVLLVRDEKRPTPKNDFNGWVYITESGKNYFQEKENRIDYVCEFPENGENQISIPVNAEKTYAEKKPQISKDNDNTILKFSGILGNDCGNVEPYSGSDKRLNEKGFTVKDGIPTLRGFAKMSDLAMVSVTKYDEYQRSKNNAHIADIECFLESCKAEAKFLPEVVLSVNSPDSVKIEKYSASLPSTVSSTVKGMVDNLDYYTITVEKGALSRVDGNHRLEAGKNKDLYIPFSIILWNVDINQDKTEIQGDSDANTESEAFLFYILNNTARKLEAEENFKGLVKSKNWTEQELALINQYLPILKHFNEKYLGNPLVDSDILFAPLSQVCEVLTEINDLDLGKEEFDVLFADSIKITNQTDKYGYCRKEFLSIFFQLAFYTRYKSSDCNSAIRNLDLVDKWLEKYKYKSATFTKASKIYDVAYRFISCSPKTIFMAMQYKSDEIVADYNGALSRAVHTINNFGGNIEIEAYPIMTGEGKSINITSDIYSKIENCSIFIADTTEANPNVMYELGIAYNQKKPIIMVREKGKQIKVPSDIISEYYYNFGSMSELENLFVKHIKTILINDYGAVFPD